MTETTRNQIKDEKEEEEVIFDEEMRYECQSESENDHSTLSSTRFNKRRKLVQLDSNSDLDSDENDSLLDLEFDEEDIVYLNNIQAKSPFRIFIEESDADLPVSQHKL